MTIRLSTLSAASARASRKSETVTGMARTPIPPPLPPPDSIQSEDELSDGKAAEDAKLPVVLSPAVSAAAASSTAASSTGGGPKQEPGKHQTASAPVVAE